jgi:MoxR-like ATPase
MEQAHQWVQPLFTEMRKVIVGQLHLLRSLVIALLADGHILLEGVPGLAKTLSIQTLAQTIQASFRRIQFTPDLLPADLMGTEIYDPRRAEFHVKKGPIFANLILADEINRAPAKVQSALLEAMQERQVTIGGHTFPLEEPFLVLATQNPIEHEGTYPLPEAQVDRFMMKVLVDYPTPAEEEEIINRMTAPDPITVRPVISTREILKAREVVKRIHVDVKIKRYVVELVTSTRPPKRQALGLEPLVEYGASPRASIYLIQAAKAWAFLEGRPYVKPEDIKAVAPDILRHRIILSYEAEAEELTSDEIIRRLLTQVRTP